MILNLPFDRFGFEFLNIECTDSAASLLQELPQSGLAVVGTRSPQLRSFHLLEKTLRELRDSNLIIVSGFARGIDSKAHELALELGLKTIAILGCGLNIDYPKENRSLRTKIIENGGMLISPFPPDAPALAHHFLNRNQLIAYFSKAVWVVEAAAISGSLNTANHASRMDRDLYATPAFPSDPLYRGNELLLSQSDPHKYPVAEPLYGAHSLIKSWRELKIHHHDRHFFKKHSRVQKWVDDLKHRDGICNFQTLLRHSLESGMKHDQFYLEYNGSLQKGEIIEGPLGTIELQ